MRFRHPPHVCTCEMYAWTMQLLQLQLCNGLRLMGLGHLLHETRFDFHLWLPRRGLLYPSHRRRLLRYSGCNLYLWLWPELLLRHDFTPVAHERPKLVHRRHPNRTHGATLNIACSDLIFGHTPQHFHLDNLGTVTSFVSHHFD